MHISSPCSSFGYYRGSPDTVASPQSLLNGGVTTMQNVFTQGTGASAPGGSAGGWHPTVLYMFLLILAEMFVFAWVSRHI